MELSIGNNITCSSVAYLEGDEFDSRLETLDEDVAGGLLPCIEGAQVDVGQPPHHVTIKLCHVNTQVRCRGK